MLSNGRTFATAEMLLGFVPYETRVGARIAILIGCSVPVFVRSTMETGRWVVSFLTWKQEEHHFLSPISECYIAGLMEGESVDIVRERHPSPQAITSE